MPEKDAVVINEDNEGEDLGGKSVFSKVKDYFNGTFITPPTEEEVKEEARSNIEELEKPVTAPVWTGLESFPKMTAKVEKKKRSEYLALKTGERAVDYWSPTKVLLPDGTMQGINEDTELNKVPDDIVANPYYLPSSARSNEGGVPDAESLKSQRKYKGFNDGVAVGKVKIKGELKNVSYPYGASFDREGNILANNEEGYRIDKNGVVLPKAFRYKKGTEKIEWLTASDAIGNLKATFANSQVTRGEFIHSMGLSVPSAVANVGASLARVFEGGFREIEGMLEGQKWEGDVDSFSTGISYLNNFIAEGLQDGSIALSKGSAKVANALSTGKSSLKRKKALNIRIANTKKSFFEGTDGFELDAPNASTVAPMLVESLMMGGGILKLAPAGIDLMKKLGLKTAAEYAGTGIANATIVSSLVYNDIYDQARAMKLSVQEVLNGLFPYSW